MNSRPLSCLGMVRSGFPSLLQLNITYLPHRLFPLVEATPKPLLPVGNEPVISYALKWCEDSAVNGPYTVFSTLHTNSRAQIYSFYHLPPSQTISLLFCVLLTLKISQTQPNRSKKTYIYAMKQLTTTIALAGRLQTGLGISRMRLELISSSSLAISSHQSRFPYQKY